MTPFERAWRYATCFDKRRLGGLTKTQCLAIGFEKGMASRSGIPEAPKKSSKPMKVFVKPKQQ